jgi:hypothetical protein
MLKKITIYKKFGIKAGYRANIEFYK